MIKITADSTCDLAPWQIQENDISIMPLNVILGGKSFEDGVDITPADIFAYVQESGTLPKTSARNAAEYTEFFRQFTDKGDTVIHFNISDRCSATHRAAQEAAKAFPGKVFAVDTQALSTGQGLLVMKACDLRAAGLGAEEIVEQVNALRHLVNTSFVPDRLDYLYYGGRCSRMTLYGSRILNIHPLIAMKDGQLYAKKKYMGNMQRCLRNYLQDLKEEYPAYDRRRCFVTHSNADAALVQFAKERVQELFDFAEVVETVAGSVITGHCGRNTLGVLFIAEETTS